MRSSTEGNGPQVTLLAGWPCLALCQPSCALLSVTPSGNCFLAGVETPCQVLKALCPQLGLAVDSSQGQVWQQCWRVSGS